MNQEDPRRPEIRPEFQQKAREVCGRVHGYSPPAFVEPIAAAIQECVEDAVDKAVCAAVANVKQATGKEIQDLRDKIDSLSTPRPMKKGERVSNV